MNSRRTAEQLAASREKPDNAPLTDSEKILLKTALRANDNPESVTADDIQHASAAGFSQRDVFDTVAQAAAGRAFSHVLRTFNLAEQGLSFVAQASDSAVSRLTADLC